MAFPPKQKLQQPGVPGQSGQYGGINPGGIQSQGPNAGGGFGANTSQAAGGFMGGQNAQQPASPFGGSSQQAGGFMGGQQATQPASPFGGSSQQAGGFMGGQNADVARVTAPNTGVNGGPSLVGDQRPTATPPPPAAAPTVEGFQSWAQSTFGRQATPQELQQIGARVGAPAGPGGQFTQQQFEQAQQYAQEIARAQGWTGQPATPAGPVDPFQQANIPQAPNAPQMPTAPGAPQITPVEQPNVNLPQAQAPNVLGQMPEPSALQQQLSQQISQWMGQQPGANLQNDPVYRAQTDAYNVASQRGSTRDRAALAEQSGTQGLSRGALNSVLERQGERESGFAAQLAGQRLTEQQNQIQQAMQLADAMGNRELSGQLQERAQQLQQAGLGLQAQGLNQQGALAGAGLDLQAQGMNQQGQIAGGQLANQLFGQQSQNALGLGSLGQQGFGQMLSALMQQRGLDMQGNLGGRDLDLRRLLGLGNLQLGYHTANQQNDQANNRLGFDYTQLQNDANQSSLMAMLMGGY